MSLCLHEFAHALVAHRGGDTAIRARGYLTLDIRRYTNVGLTFVLPVLFLLLGGIPLPGGAVLIDHGALRSRAVRSLVSFAGPAVNLVLGVVLAVAVAAVPMPVGLAAGLSCLALIQVLAFVLNMLPVPGLDGFGVLEPYLPDGARQFAAKVRRGRRWSCWWCCSGCRSPTGAVRDRRRAVRAHRRRRAPGRRRLLRAAVLAALTDLDARTRRPGSGLLPHAGGSTLGRPGRRA